MSFDLPVLPQDWSYASLESCSQPNSVTYGVVQPGSALEAGKPLIRVNNFRDTRIDLSDVMFIAPEIEAKYSRTRLQGGEVLLTIVGSVGQVAVVPPWCAGFNVARAVAVIHPQPNIAPEWIALCLRSPLSQHLLESRANTTVQTTINLKDLRVLPIPLPPPAERQAIVGFVGALDDRITLLRETNATLEAIAQALFKSWFVDFDPVRAKIEGRAPAGMDEATATLFPDSLEVTELGLVPRGWRVANVGTIAAVIDCLHSKKPELFDSGKPFLQLNNIRNDGLLDASEVSGISNADYEKWISRIEVSAGDCVITNVGRVGAVAQIPSGFQAAMGRNMTAIRLKPNWPYPTYLIELLQSQWMRSEIVNKTDTGTILNALNVKNIPLLRCNLATSEVMQAFEGVTRPLRAGMEENIKYAQILASLRDTLLPRLISGQLRLPDVQQDVVDTL
jgi:type I restriction enzyme S subunit